MKTTRFYRRPSSLGLKIVMRFIDLRRRLCQQDKPELKKGTSDSFLGLARKSESHSSCLHLDLDSLHSKLSLSPSPEPAASSPTSRDTARPSPKSTRTKSDVVTSSSSAVSSSGVGVELGGDNDSGECPIAPLMHSTYLTSVMSILSITAEKCHSTKTCYETGDERGK